MGILVNVNSFFDTSGITVLQWSRSAGINLNVSGKQASMPADNKWLLADLSILDACLAFTHMKAAIISLEIWQTAWYLLRFSSCSYWSHA